MAFSAAPIDGLPQVWVQNAHRIRSYLIKTELNVQKKKKVTGQIRQGMKTVLYFASSLLLKEKERIKGKRDSLLPLWYIFANFIVWAFNQV